MIVGGPNTWDLCHNIRRLQRPPTYPLSEDGFIEEGAAFFVLMIERLGGVTEHSCEGHPRSFYISFRAPKETGQRLRAATPPPMRLEGGATHGWRLGIREAPDFGHEDRLRILRDTADAWEKAFGSLVVDPETVETSGIAPHTVARFFGMVRLDYPEDRDGRVFIPKAEFIDLMKHQWPRLERIYNIEAAVDVSIVCGVLEQRGDNLTLGSFVRGWGSHQLDMFQKRLG